MGRALFAHVHTAHLLVAAFVAAMHNAASAAVVLVVLHLVQLYRLAAALGCIHGS